MMVPKAKDLLRQLQSPFQANKRGGILILTLWSLFLLTMFAVYLGYGVRQKLVLAHRLDERDRLRFIAEAGIKRAIVVLTEEDLEDYTSLSDSWSDNIAVFKERHLGDGVYDISYNYMDEISNSIYTRYGLVDEESKISINKADQKTLRRLFRIALDFNTTEAQKLAASIVDWRDGDGALSIPIGSAEDREYRGLHYPYEAKDAEFEVLEEVLLVNGMDEDIFERLKDYITIYGDGKVNINTASKTVLLALGLGGDIVYKILFFRYGEDKILGTPDDGIVTSHATIIPQLSQFSSLSESQLAELTRIVEQNLITYSSNFMIRSISKLKNKKGTTEIICVVDQSGKILYWHES